MRKQNNFSQNSYKSIYISTDEMYFTIIDWWRPIFLVNKRWFDEFAIESHIFWKILPTTNVPLRTSDKILKA